MGHQGGTPYPVPRKPASAPLTTGGTQREEEGPRRPRRVKGARERDSRTGRAPGRRAPDQPRPALSGKARSCSRQREREGRGSLHLLRGGPRGSASTRARTRAHSHARTPRVSRPGAAPFLSAYPQACPSPPAPSGRGAPRLSPAGASGHSGAAGCLAGRAVFLGGWRVSPGFPGRGGGQCGGGAGPPLPITLGRRLWATWRTDASWLLRSAHPGRVLHGSPASPPGVPRGGAGEPSRQDRPCPWVLKPQL